MPCRSTEAQGPAKDDTAGEKEAVDIMWRCPCVVTLPYWARVETLKGVPSVC